MAASPPRGHIPNLPPDAFRKQDASPDSQSYRIPRFAIHIDKGAVATVTRAYRDILPPNGRVLDLVSSWVSHLPPEVAYAEVICHGLNAEELAANARLSRYWVQDLNVDPILPLEDRSLDGAVICVSIQYLQDPVSVLTNLRRTLRPGAPEMIAFSDRCFPTKAVAVWLALDCCDHRQLVRLYLQEAGFASAVADKAVPRGGRGDPLWIVTGRA